MDLLFTIRHSRLILPLYLSEKRYNRSEAHLNKSVKSTKALIIRFPLYQPLLKIYRQL